MEIAGTIPKDRPGDGSIQVRGYFRTTISFSVIVSAPAVSR
jgi:hypothetical protein